jgi:hypothetical protein
MARSVGLEGLGVEVQILCTAYSRVSLPPRTDDEWEDIEEVPALAESPPATAPGTLQQLAETLGATGTRKPTGPKTSANVV